MKTNFGIKKQRIAKESKLFPFLFKKFKKKRASSNTENISLRVKKNRDLLKLSYKNAFKFLFSYLEL